MFTDPTLRWRPYPSIIDGIERPPSVFDRGFRGGVLHLLVMGPRLGNRAYGVELECDIYSGIEEMLHSVAGGGGLSGAYDGSVYIKEAESSALINTYSKLMEDYVWMGRENQAARPRHFLFVGADLCYEALGTSEPKIRALGSPEEAHAWPQRSD